MTRKTNSPPKRRREIRSVGPNAAVESEIGELSEKQLDAYWKVNARAALTVDALPAIVRRIDPTSKVDPAHEPFANARRRLFKHFGLNPNDPWHWRQLIDYFAYIEFWEKPRNKPGRPRKDWSEDDAVIAAAIVTLPSQSNTKLGVRLTRAKDSPLRGKSLRSARAHVARVKKSLLKAGT